MHTISRRQVVGAGAVGMGVITSSLLLRATARAATTTRFDVTTNDGKAMLKIYADAVGKMMARAEKDTQGWTFQWYTHAVRSDRSKTAEINRIYGTGTGPDAALAKISWSTCEPHFNPSHSDFFLPWHRMYVLCFEQIIRQVSGKDEFTLPYWNYTNANNRVLPTEFTKKGDSTWGPLFRDTRNHGVNTGTPIDQAGPRESIDLGAMQSTSYSDNGSDAGFCNNTDADPHGSVHDDIGNPQTGMGTIPWAANDPIFFLHHCNIDRIWASWNKAGGQNASLTGTYSFAGGDGKKVDLDVAKFMDPDTTTHGYQYDNYLQRPAGSPAFARPDLLVARSIRQAVSRQATSGPIRLGAAASTVALSPTPAPGAAAPRSVNEFSTALRSLPQDSRFILRLDDVRASAPPGVGYDVYVGLAKDAKPNRKDPSYAGTISFFGAAAHGAMAGMPGMADMKGPAYSFYINYPVQAAGAAASAVTLVPTGTPAKDAVLTIGSISLISQ